MKKRTFPETLEALCRSDPEFVKNGRINQAAVARATKMNQSTIHRMLEGQSKEPTPDNARKLCKYFGVTREQLIGEDPIPGLDSGDDKFPRLLAAVHQAKELPGEEQEMLAAVIEGFLMRKKSPDK